MGATGRGEDMEITTYLESALTSELQGNLVDICPVGALTSKPYAFAARPWELGKTQSIDVMDGVGSAIRVDTRGREVMRILPRVNEAVNEEWISDKTRHIVDGLRTQRLDRPYIRENGQLRAASWHRLSRPSPPRFRPHRRQADRRHCRRSRRGGGDVRAEGAAGEMRLGQSRGAGRRRVRPEAPAARPTFSIRPLPVSIRRTRLLIIGSNPRKEAAVLNARIRKRWRSGQLKIGRGRRQGAISLTRMTISAPGTESLGDLAAGKHSFADVLKDAKNPIVLVGADAFARHDGAAVLALRQSSRWISARSRTAGTALAVLHEYRLARRRARYRLCAGAGGLSAAQMTTFGTLDVLFLLGADEVKVRRGHLRGLYRHPWRPRRASRRRDPAGRRLHRKAGLYRQHRRPGADGQPRGASRPGRRGKTGRLSVRCRRLSAKRLPYDSLAALAAGDLQGRAASDAASTRSKPATPPISRRSRARAAGREDAVQGLGRGFLSDQPDRARVCGHGGMFPSGLRANADGSGVSVT